MEVKRKIVTFKTRLNKLLRIPQRTVIHRVSIKEAVYLLGGKTPRKKELNKNIITVERKFKNKSIITVKTDIDNRCLRPI